ncbi:hypothetical protein D9619_009299 [Psilocybe cf. subviscida]|uniref:Peptidase C14 caspase domain-containing protein n=1 Tax=Psilocybe cf. subviscida TaxID=2480587 RepID=A0A8H5BU91_9AGAR|nr:hypothetical protein D9619_009299 [Psilocybe cf. subviscida]
MPPVVIRHKRALIIGLNYTHNPSWKLKGAQNEIIAASALLRDTYMFSATDVVVMSDYEGIDDSLLPTRANIIHQLNNFVVVGNENTDYVFIYAGHTDQFPDTMELEEDGMAECIVPYDAIPLADEAPDENKVIFDFELNQYMIRRLGRGSRLTAIAASCHSATLLNLPHYRCNRPFRHLASKDGARHTLRRFVCNPLEVTVTKMPRVGRQSESPDDVTLSDSSRYVVRKRVRIGDPAYQEAQGVCTGLCCLPVVEVDGSNAPTVVCISACKDGEKTFEDRDGNSMLQCIIDYLKKNNTPTLEEVMIHVQDNAEETFDAVRAHQKQHGDSSRRHLFQRGHDSMLAKRWEPQLSSTQPLNLKSQLILCQMPIPSPFHGSSRSYRASNRL